MNNLVRLKMEIQGINITDDNLNVYLQENEFDPQADYSATSKTNLKNIYKTALSVLESIANNPSSMKDYKTDDMTVSSFQENLQSRIDYLNRKIRLMPDDADSDNDFGNFIYIFKD